MNRLWRAAFIVYAPALLLGTLWPNMEIRGPVERTDLWIHAPAFGLWGLLLYASQLLGARSEWRNVALSGIISLAWAGIDEWAQRFCNRVSAADDFAANALGVWVAMAISAAWCARLRNASDDAA